MSQAEVPSIRRQSKNEARWSFCRVCHDKARIVHYGSLSCHSCKAFFRRHGQRISSTPACQYGGHCEVGLETRKTCVCCRLKKCLAVGMTPVLIRKDFPDSRCRGATKMTNREIIPYQHRSQVVPVMRVLDLLNCDRSSLTALQWQLFSNVINAVDRFSFISSVRHMMKTLAISQSAVQIGIPQTFSFVISSFQAVQAFIESTPDFRVLSVAEQTSLLQRNLNGLYTFAGIFVFGQAGIYDNIQNAAFMLPMYGSDSFYRAKRIYTRLDRDSNLVKMMQIILAFSSNCNITRYDERMDNDPFIRGTFRLLGSQDMYVEILWKYMLYRYHEAEANQRFAALVKLMLDLMTFSDYTYSTAAHHKTLVDHVIKQAETTLVLNENKVVPLWGGSVNDLLTEDESTFILGTAHPCHTQIDENFLREKHVRYNRYI